MLKRKATSSVRRNAKRLNPSTKVQYKQLFIVDVLKFKTEEISEKAPPEVTDFYPKATHKIKRFLTRALSVRGPRDRSKKKYIPMTCIVQGKECSGKTYLIRNVIKAMELPCIELGADCLRSGTEIKRILTEASKSLSVNNTSKGNRVIFIDDIDVTLPPDKGFLPAVLTLIAKTKFPIILSGANIPRDLEIIKTVERVTLKEPDFSLFFKNLSPNPDLIDQTEKNLYKLFNIAIHSIKDSTPQAALLGENIHRNSLELDLLSVLDKGVPESIEATYHTAALDTFILSTFKTDFNS